MGCRAKSSAACLNFIKFSGNISQREEEYSHKLVRPFHYWWSVHKLKLEKNEELTVPIRYNN